MRIAIITGHGNIDSLLERLMNTREAIGTSIQTADMVCNAYLGDLSDEDMMRRPHPGCNHINWQVGHLIASDNQMLNGCFPDALPALPAGFTETYSRENTTSDDATAFSSKEELMKLYGAQRAAIMEKLNSMSDEGFDAPAPEAMQSYAPTVGAVFNMLGAHWLMHAGQWVIVRREAGRDIVI